MQFYKTSYPYTCAFSMCRCTLWQFKKNISGTLNYFHFVVLVMALQLFTIETDTYVVCKLISFHKEVCLCTWLYIIYFYKNNVIMNNVRNAMWYVFIVWYGKLCCLQNSKSCYFHYVIAFSYQTLLYQILY